MCYLAGALEGACLRAVHLKGVPSLKKRLQELGHTHGYQGHLEHNGIMFNPRQFVKRGQELALVRVTGYDLPCSMKTNVTGMCMSCIAISGIKGHGLDTGQKPQVKEVMVMMTLVTIRR